MPRSARRPPLSQSQAANTLQKQQIDASRRLDPRVAADVLHCHAQHTAPNPLQECVMVKRLFQVLLVLSLVAVTLRAANDPFVGKWKLNPDKSTLTDEMKVNAVGPNKYGFDFGSGNPEIIVVDGTDQPGLEGSTLAVTAEGPNNWRVVRKKDGRMQISAIWTLSADGNTLHDNFTGYQSNGSNFHLDYFYARTAGSSGFSGTWDSTSGRSTPLSKSRFSPTKTMACRSSMPRRNRRRI